MKKQILVPIVFIMAIFFSRCSSDDICLSNQNSAQIGLYSAYSSTDKDTVLTDLTVIGIGLSDSLLYDKASENKLFLPMSMHSDTSAFLFQVQTLHDTLWFTYRRDLSYVSGSCGMAVEIEIDTMWFNGRFIDSVAIVQPLIKYNENFENIKIYID